MRQWRFDAVLLDIDEVGQRATHQIEALATRTGTPLLLLSTAVAEEAALMLALDHGVADWIFKPASARLLALKLRRQAQGAANAHVVGHDVVSMGSLRITPRRGVALADCTPLALTSGQFNLLLLLASRSGKIVSRAEIARAGLSVRASGRSIDNQICCIRRQLLRHRVSDLELRTVRGEGYCLSQARIAASTTQGLQRFSAHLSIA